MPILPTLDMKNNVRAIDQVDQLFDTVDGNTCYVEQLLFLISVPIIANL